MEQQYLDLKSTAKQSIYTHSQIKNWLEKREENGLDAGVVKYGKKLYIDTKFFNEWAINNKKGPSKTGGKRRRSAKRISPELAHAIKDHMDKYNGTATITKAGENNGNDGVCRVVTIPHRAGFFERVYEFLFQGKRRKSNLP